ncbi:acetate/propionate family kinase [Natronospora cellulosivora (SeqCode)]
MKILVLNSGSSSIKFQLFNMEDESVIAKGSVTRIGNQDSRMKYKTDNDKVEETLNVEDHSQGLQVIKEYLMGEKTGVIKDVAEISAIGHRVVHGGEKYFESILIDEDAEKNIDKLSELAPLHNPHNLKGIQECKTLIPDTPQVAVFDTGFHQTMPAKAYLYALPYDLYEEDGVRRYGFHGTSHKFVAQRAADMMNKDISDLKIITCHLGNGASIAAVKGGKSVDTSMGLTPLEGLVMGTRSGDTDPSILPFIMKRKNVSAEAAENILNKESGLLGVSGISNDFREINEAAQSGNKQAKKAFDVFCYRIQKYIGAYMVAMGGVDAIIFTGGIGENEGVARAGIIDALDFMGVSLDEEANQRKSEEIEISTSDSKVKVFVIPTNEELVIARATKDLL